MVDILADKELVFNVNINKSTTDMKGNGNVENQKLNNGLTKYIEEYDKKDVVINDAEQNTHM